MNGVPTAYDDLESLLTNSENQLERSYKHLPAFLQDLIKKLPSKMTQSIGPEMLAAAAEKQGMNTKYMNKGAHAAEKMGMKVRVPSLKDLVTKPGAVAGLLKTIMNFLKLRFPAFLGMNVLYSLGLFGMYPHSNFGNCGFEPLDALCLKADMLIYSSPLRLLVLSQTWQRSPTREGTSPDRKGDGRTR